MHLICFQFIISYIFYCFSLIFPSRCTLFLWSKARKIPSWTDQGKHIKKIIIQVFFLSYYKFQVVGNLRNLDLSGNRIKVLPENIGAFKMLKTLTMSKNQLDSIPQVHGYNLEDTIQNKLVGRVIFFFF